MTTITHPRNMLKHFVAAFLTLHGVIHAVGFAWAFQLAEFEDLSGPTLLLQASEPEDPMILAMGALWMVAALAFICASIGVARASSWGLPLAGAAAAVSLVVTIVWWNDARIGAVISAAVLFGVAAVHRSNEIRRTRSPFAARALRAQGQGGTS